jgi:hypothetical protein
MVMPMNRPLAEGEAKITLTSVERLGGCCLITFSSSGIKSGSDSMTATLDYLQRQGGLVRCNCGNNELEVGDVIFVARDGPFVLNFIQLVAEKEPELPVIDATTHLQMT